MIDKLTYIYLHSVEHSGSTLVACILGAHPDITTIGEFSSINISKKGLCSCGQQYNNCPLWKKWAKLATDREYTFEIGNLGINLQPDHNNDKLEDLYYYNFSLKALDALRDLLFKFSVYKKIAMQKIERYFEL
jgi:hypothetical protein